MIKALEVCTNRFPKISRYSQHKIQRCSVHMNKKETFPQIWKYWITSTMSWHWKANCNVKNPSVCFLLAHQFKFVSFPPVKFQGRVNPQIQARCAEDVDGARQAEYWVKLKRVCSSCSSTCCLCRQWGLLTSGIATWDASIPAEISRRYPTLLSIAMWAYVPLDQRMIRITAELMPFGMGSFAELMLLGMGSSQSMCLLPWVWVSLAYAFRHGLGQLSMQNMSICALARLWDSNGVPKQTTFFVLFIQKEANSSLHWLR